ncbi:hypothetical protein BC834DRAFT_974468 [Gloeopeniophorella convolvens]|nr:hypothetical protein BC834DRAFT_974468 [Gloeopeniophorella convolvens]
MPLPPSVIQEIVHALHISQGFRYISLVGLVTVLYDHALTFDDELRLIWRAPNSFAKWIILSNRYITEIALIAVANEMSGFHSYSYSDTDLGHQCLTNLLTFLRVVVLWNKAPRVVLGLGAMFFLSFFMTLAFMIASMVILGPSIRWNPIGHMCTLSKSTPILAAVWAAPMGFEISVLALTLYNALSRPRDSQSALAQALHRDGMLFFVAIPLLRLINIIFTSTGDPKRITYAVFFVWALLTVGINHMVIQFRSSELKAEGESSYTTSALSSGRTSVNSLQRNVSAPSLGSTNAGAVELNSFWDE